MHDRYDEMRQHKSKHFPEVTKTEDANTYDRQNRSTGSIEYKAAGMTKMAIQKSMEKCDYLTSAKRAKEESSILHKHRVL